LQNFPGGTYPFFTNDIATCQKPKLKNIVIMQHIPMQTNDFGTNVYFPRDFLVGFNNNVSGIYSGHWHTQRTIPEGSAYTNYVLNDLWGSDGGDTWLRIVNVNTQGSTIQYTQSNIVCEITNIITPVGVWHLDEGTANFCADVSQYHGTLLNDCYGFNISWTNGMMGRALYFNGSSSYAAISNFSYFYPISGASLNSSIAAITVSAWIKTSSSRGAIIDFDTDYNWSLGINVNGLAALAMSAGLLTGQIAALRFAVAA